MNCGCVSSWRAIVQIPIDIFEWCALFIQLASRICMQLDFITLNFMKMKSSEIALSVGRHSQMFAFRLVCWHECAAVFVC